MLQRGVFMTNSRGESHLVKVCVNCIQCDLQAQRKLLGHAFHNARRGCNFCDFEFPSNRYNNYSQTDFSQHLDVSVIPRRYNATHRDASKKYLQAKTKKDREVVRTATGTSYTPLERLEYFDCIEGSSVDTMHLCYLDKYLAILYIVSH